MSRKFLGLLVFVVFGFAKLPVEDRVLSSLREQKLIEAPLNLDLRENLGQMGFAASLGGLRSLVASITYLQAYVAFEDVDWGRVDSLMTLTTRLQPHEPEYWSDASWHMAYNAASNYMNNQELRFAIRNKLFRDYIQRGIDILDEGLRYLPNNPQLLTRLGDIYRDRQVDHRKAAECYLAAAAHGAKSYYERMGAYQLVLLDDRASWEKAYAILKKEYDEHKAVYDRKDMGRSSVMRDLPILEQRLNIPADQRIRPAVPLHLIK